MISIITPTYNRAELLPRMIKSVLAQTFTNWELLIMDDGSEDKTAEVVSYFKDSRIKFFSSRNSGAADKRNQGVRKAKGEFITFLDSDDEVTTEWLKKMTDPLAENKNRVVSCGWEKYDNSGKLVETGMPKNLGSLFNEATLNFLSGCLLYRKQEFLEAGGYDTRLPSGHHTEILFRLLPVWERQKVDIKAIYEPLVKIHLHKGERIRYNHTGIYVGTKMMLDKHAQLFLKNPNSHYEYLSVAGVQAIKSGRITEAQEIFTEALKIKPFNLKSIFRVIISYIPGCRKVFWKN